jgi:hypothetical protein
VLFNPFENIRLEEAEVRLNPNAREQPSLSFVVDRYYIALQRIFEFLCSKNLRLTRGDRPSHRIRHVELERTDPLLRRWRCGDRQHPRQAHPALSSRWSREQPIVRERQRRTNRGGVNQIHRHLQSRPHRSVGLPARLRRPHQRPACQQHSRVASQVLAGRAALGAHFLHSNYSLACRQKGQLLGSFSQS